MNNGFKAFSPPQVVSLSALPSAMLQQGSAIEADY